MVKKLLNLFFPKVCYGCDSLLSDHEVTICTLCRHKLPVTNYHFDNDSTVEKVFYGRVKVEQATALLRFEKKGIVQHLMHHLKYKGYEEIGRTLGAWMGEELKASPGFNSIDLVIPVPLHKKKLRKRGFNQVTLFGQEIAKTINADYCDDVLIKESSTSTQVFKKRWARWNDDNSTFKVINPVKITNKHILLVDDIITTGATLESCSAILLKHRNSKISIAAMAIA